MPNNKKIDLDLSDENKSFSERIDEVRSLVEENLRYTKSLKQSPSVKGIEVNSQEEIKKLLQENLKVSKDLYEMTSKIKRWVAVQRVWGILKILIIVIPIVLGLIYLPSLLKQVAKPYQEFLQATSSISGLGNNNLFGQGLIKQTTD